jgi:hypothetical protein
LVSADGGHCDVVLLSRWGDVIFLASAFLLPTAVMGRSKKRVTVTVTVLGTQQFFGGTPSKMEFIFMVIINYWGRGACMKSSTTFKSNDTIISTLFQK